MVKVKVLLLEDGLAGAGAPYIPGGVVVNFICEESEVKKKAKEIWEKWDEGDLDSLHYVDTYLTLEELYYSKTPAGGVEQSIKGNVIHFDSKLLPDITLDYVFGSSDLKEEI